MDADKFSGLRKMYWDKEIDGVCRGGDIAFVNPNAQAIERNTMKKVKYVAKKRRVNVTEVIVLEHDVRIVGLSLAKSSLPQSMESMGACGACMPTSIAKPRSL